MTPLVSIPTVFPVPGLSEAELLALGFVQQVSGTWAPLDYSAGGLSLNYFGTPQWNRIGNLVNAVAAINWPVTADPNDVVIGALPWTPDANNSLNQFSAGFSVAAGYLSPFLSIGFGGQVWYYLSPPLTRATNADLSGLTIYFRLIYTTSDPFP